MYHVCKYICYLLKVCFIQLFGHKDACMLVETEADPFSGGTRFKAKHSHIPNISQLK